MNIINGETGVSISVLVGTFPLLVAAVLVWAKLHAIQKQLKNVWSIPHQKIFAERLKNRNHKLDVPDVSEVLDTFTTNGTN